MHGFRDEGGLFGIAGHRQAAHLAYLGLHALQHRGSDGAGIVASDGNLLRVHHGTGLIQEVFGGPQLQALTGQIAVGQVHHLGGGAVAPQVLADRPLLVRYQGGQLAMAMLGQFVNRVALRTELKAQGALFSTVSDAEILLHLLSRSSQQTPVNRLVDALWKVEGAFSLLLCSEDRLIAVRDPCGFRPLLLGRVDGATVVTSEDGPLRLLGGDVWREVAPGEMVIVDPDGVRTVRPFPRRARTACIQELVALARDDGRAFGQAAYSVRKALGGRLHREQPCDKADVVLGLPDGSVPAALGYAHAAGVGFQHGLLLAPYTGRQYVEPPQEIPDFGVRLRYLPVPEVVDRQRVVLVTASVVTGEATRRCIRLIREAGAEEVHLRVASPMVRGSCYYGVVSPTEEELAAHRHPDLTSFTRWLGANTVGFLSVRGLHAILGRSTDGQSLWCDGCYSSDYPLVPPELVQEQLVMFEEEEPEGS